MRKDGSDLAILRGPDGVGGFTRALPVHSMNTRLNCVSHKMPGRESAGCGFLSASRSPNAEFTAAFSASAKTFSISSRGMGRCSGGFASLGFFAWGGRAFARAAGAGCALGTDRGLVAVLGLRVLRLIQRKSKSTVSAKAAPNVSSGESDSMGSGEIEFGSVGKLNVSMRTCAS